MSLRLFNTLTRKKEIFTPITPDNVRMYVCGPTVYDHAHIGNARPIIVFDVLYRLLRHIYGETHVTYVRNITDVDDKINARAAEEGVSIGEITARTTKQFHQDIAALGVLPPDKEPRATDHIAGMITMIETLVERGHAYEADGHVLFSVSSDASYGCLSNRSPDEMLAGARVDIASYKKDPMDFVLWKPSTPELPGWDSPWGRGRPGWHIECSVMSEKYLGKTFDIHGGGLDLIFPHHENEIAQSTCAHGNTHMANYFVHNGYLQVEGEKMSKSLGNFITIHELLETEKFGGRKWPGEVLRLAMLMTHYREPIDFSVSRLIQAERVLNKLRDFAAQRVNRVLSKQIWDQIQLHIKDDLNTPAVIQIMEEATKSNKKGYENTVYRALKFLGFTGKRPEITIVANKFVDARKALQSLSENQFQDMFVSVYRNPFFPSGNLKPEAKILDELSKLNFLVEKSYNEFSRWRKNSAELRNHEFRFQETNRDRDIQQKINERLVYLRQKDWDKADSIREKLLSEGIQLKDSKDPDNGERITTWEIKR